MRTKWHGVMFRLSLVLRLSQLVVVHSELLTGSSLYSSQCFPSDDYACCFRALLFIGFMRPTVNSWVRCVSQWTPSSFSFTPLNPASIQLNCLASTCPGTPFTLSVWLVGAWTTNYEVIIIEHSWWRACWLWWRKRGSLAFPSKRCVA